MQTMNNVVTGKLPRLSLRVNFIWVMIGNFIYAGCQWGALIAISRIGTPAMLGQFSLGLAIATPVLMFTNLDLREIQATDVKNEYLFNDYFGLRIIGTGLGLLVIVALVFGLGYQQDTALVILAVGMAKIFESMSDVFYGLYQRLERMNYIAQSMASKGILSLLGVALGMYCTHNVLWATFGMAVGWAIVLFAFDVRYGYTLLESISVKMGTNIPATRRGYLRPSFVIPTLRRLAWLGLPLGVATLLYNFSSLVPRYFIEWHLDVYSLGIFAALSYLPVVGVTVINALARAATPRLATYYVQGNRALFLSLLLKLLGIGAMVGVLGWLTAAFMGRPIVTLIYGSEYANYTEVLTQILISTGLTYMVWFLGSALIAARYLRLRLLVLGLVTVVQIVTCMWLIPVYGMSGAPMAMIITALIHFLATLVIVAYIFSTMRKAPSGVAA
jgi:O-antigen/teichoic acid export membrane protein